MFEIKVHKKMGRGLFATKKIKAGTVVEVSPVIVFDKVEGYFHTNTLMNHYVYSWGNKGESALALGHGSLFNHSSEANVNYKTNLRAKTITFWAERDIEKGEQLFIDYGYDPVQAYSIYLKEKR